MSGAVVLGMHRSGTSAVAQLLGLLGLEPVADDLMPADEHNAKGYWESAALVRFDDELLAAFGCSWACPPPLAGWRPQDAAGLAEQARARFGPLFARPGWVWKDPRACLTFPFWRRALPLDPVVVLVHRDPGEVAASLAARDGIGTAHAHALWERYVRHALAAAEGLPAYVVSYADLLDDPAARARELRAVLAAHGLPAAEPDGAAVAAVVDSALRRARGTSEPSPEQAALVRALGGLRGRHDTFAAGTLPPETPGLDWALASGLAGELARSRARVGALEAEVANVLDSRTFRWTAPARRLAGLVVRARAARATSTPRAAGSRP